MLNRRTTFLCLSLALFFFGPAPAASAYPVTFTDDAGRAVSIPVPPARIVSQVPLVTDILNALGSREQLVKANGEILFLPADRKIDGGDEPARRIAVRPGNIEEDLKWIERLGAITGRREQARWLVADIHSDLAVAAAKTTPLPYEARLPMLGVQMQVGQLVPLIDLRQRDLIARAGGRAAPTDMTTPAGEALRRFNPQLLYAAYEERRDVLAQLKSPKWRHLSAVENRRVYFFPARLLHDNLSGAGYLTNALASRAYPELYTNSFQQVRPNRIFRTRRVPVELAMVENARICHHYRYDFIAKTLVVDFKSPQIILSTLEGLRMGIRTVGNHHAAPPCWWLDAHSGLDSLQKQVLPVIDRPAEATSLLFTGADMDHLAVETARFREMHVVALVTAGVRGNAMRLSRDRGNYYEPGTINIILMSNMHLSERAMSRALVTATEAKTAALWDLDIRSSYTPRRHAATGTGTDNLIVVQNSAAGTTIDNSGGHTKMGQLIATAVYRGVGRAIAKQNGLTANRDVTARLAERWIEIDRLVADTKLPESVPPAKMTAAIAAALSRPEVIDLLTAAMSLDDATGRGMTRISSGFEGWCNLVAGSIAGHGMNQLQPLIEIGPEVPALSLALNAVWNGVLTRLQPSLPESTEKMRY